MHRAHPGQRTARLTICRRGRSVAVNRGHRIPQPTVRWMPSGGVLGSHHEPAPGRVGPDPLGTAWASCNHTPHSPGPARTVHPSVDSRVIHIRRPEETPNVDTTLPTLVRGGRLPDAVANIATDPHGVNPIGRQGHPSRSDASANATPSKGGAHRQTDAGNTLPRAPGSVKNILPGRKTKDALGTQILVHKRSLFSLSIHRFSTLGGKSGKRHGPFLSSAGNSGSDASSYADAARRGIGGPVDSSGVTG